LTGETVSVPAPERTNLRGIEEITETLKRHDHYDLIMSGMGPAALRPFALWVHDLKKIAELRKTQADACAIVEFDPKQPYAFDVSCCLGPTWSQHRIGRKTVHRTNPQCSASLVPSQIELAFSPTQPRAR